MGSKYDLLIHYKNDMFKIPDVNPDSYDLKDLLDDVVNVGFSNVPGLSHENVVIRYKSNVGGRVAMMRIWTKRGMRPIFRTKKKEIELYVELENMSSKNVRDAGSKTLESEAEMEEALEVGCTELSSMAGNDVCGNYDDNDCSGDEFKSALSDYESNSHCESDSSGDDSDDEQLIGGYCNKDDFVVSSKPINKVKLRKGMVFADVYAFRKRLQEYVVSEGFKIVREKNEKARVTARCAGVGCPWRVHASPSPDGTAYMIKTLVAKHKCVRIDKVREANSVWIADRLVDVLRKNPNMNPTEMRNELKRYGVSPPYMQLYRAKKRAMMTIEGNHNESFSLLPRYAEMVKKTNPGSLIKIEYDMENHFIPTQPRFRKVFMGLHALKFNFLEGCQPYLGFNGCHLKGPFGGILLAAVGLDGNNGLFPLAFAVVDVECKETWGFFFQCLQEMLGGFNFEKPWTFMTGRQEGLDEVINELVPDAIDRKCCKYIYSNMKQIFPDPNLKKLFWEAARSYNYADFDNAMLTLKDLNSAAFDWLMEIDFRLWARHAFKLDLKNDRLTNNIFKSFKRWVGELKSRPILTLLDGLRAKVMSRVQIRHKKGNKWKSIVTANVLKKLHVIEKESTACTLEAVSDYEFEVHEINSHYIVNLIDRTCNCRAWDLSGLPCKHAIRAISHKRESVEMYTDSSFYREKYIKAYSEKINAIPDHKFWPPMSVDPEVVLPPRRLRGRPKKNWKKDLRENTKSLLCSNCGSRGHNKRTCGPRLLKYRRKKYRRAQSLHQQEETDVSLAKMLVTMKTYVRRRKKTTMTDRIYVRKRKKTNMTDHQDEMDIPLAEVIAARKRSRKIARAEESIKIESQGLPSAPTSPSFATEPPALTYQSFDADPPALTYQSFDTNPPALTYQSFATDPPAPMYQSFATDPPAPTYHSFATDPPALTYQTFATHPHAPTSQSFASDPPALTYQTFASDPPVPTSQSFVTDTSAPTSQSFATDPPAPMSQSFATDPPALTSQSLVTDPPTPTSQSFFTDCPAPTSKIFDTEAPAPTIQSFVPDPPAPMTQSFATEPPTATTQSFATEPPTAMTQSFATEPPSLTSQSFAATPPSTTTQSFATDPLAPTLQSFVTDPPAT